MMQKKNKLCFIHIPKCGGTSINEGIRKSMGLRKYSWSYYKIDSVATQKKAKGDLEKLLEIRQSILIHKLSSRRYQYVTGHARCLSETRSQFDNEWTFLTILRDPVKRWLSQYFFNTSKKMDHFKTDLPLQAYLQSEMGLQSGSSYIRFFTGHPDLRCTEAIEEAIDNLSKFDLVGILENMSSLLDSYEKLFGHELSIPMRNTNPMNKDQMQDQLSEDLLHQVREVCSPDQRVYDHFVGQIG